MIFFKRNFLVIALLAFSFSSIWAQKSSYHHSVQPAVSSSTDAYNPSMGRLSLQFGSGVLLGTGAGLLTGLAGVVVSPKSDQPYDFRFLFYGISGFYLGYSTISAYGIYMVANSDSFNASFGNILLGNVIGGAVGYGSILLMDQLEGPPGIGLITALSAPLIGGMIANNNSIQKRGNNKTALLNISDDNASLSTPSVELKEVGTNKLPNSTASYSPTVDLLNISF